MNKLTTVIAGAAMALAALPIAVSPSQAQSFNCSYAKTPDEVLICQEPKLRSLDETLADIFFLMRNQAYAWRQAKMASEQANWLRWRMDCGRDFACIKQAYVGRIIELQNQQAAVCGITGPKLASDAFCAVFFELHDELN